MRKLRNFACKTGTIIERLVDDSVIKVKCTCGSKAAKTVSAARYFSNTVGKSPSA